MSGKTAALKKVLAVTYSILHHSPGISSGMKSKRSKYSPQPHKQSLAPFLMYHEARQDFSRMVVATILTFLPCLQAPLTLAMWESNLIHLEGTRKRTCSLSNSYIITILYVNKMPGMVHSILH